jgi:uncharacterized membrane protein
MEQFTAGSCIRFGWETFKKRPWFFIGATFFYFVIIILVSSILNELINQGGILALTGSFARSAVQMLAGMGAISFGLRAHDNVADVSIIDFWRPRPFWKYTGTAILFGIIFLAGLILIIVPGIIWGIMFGYATYLVIDKGLWPMEALKESRRITYGYKWKLLLLGIFSVLIAIVGAICLGVGLLVAYPILIVANVHAFRTLEQKAGSPASVA